MIEQAISRILEAGYTRVIIPGLGAFIKRESGETVFTDMLTHDDGVLVASLIGAGMDAEDARSAVDKFAVSLRNALAVESKASISGVGVITKDPNGRYFFVADSGNMSDAVECITTVTYNEPETVACQAGALSEDVTEVSVADMPVSDMTDINVPANKEADPEEVCNAMRIEVAALQDADGMEKDKTEHESDRKPQSYQDADVEELAVLKEMEPDEVVEEQEDIDLHYAGRSKKTVLRNALYGDCGDAEKDTETPVAHDRTMIPDAAQVSEPQKQEQTLYATLNVDADIPTVKSDSVSSESKTEAETYSPQINIRRPGKGGRKRIDGVMIVAIIALVITVGILVYGYLTERNINAMQDEEITIEMEQTE